MKKLQYFLNKCKRETEKDSKKEGKRWRGAANFDRMELSRLQVSCQVEQTQMENVVPRKTSDAGTHGTVEE